MFMVIGLSCSVFIAMEQPKRTAETEEFLVALRNNDEAKCLRMLSSPEIVAKLDFNAGDDFGMLWHRVIDLEAVALKILDMKTPDGLPVVDLNCQQNYCRDTGLMEAIDYDQRRVALKILDMKNQNGSLIANVNLQDRAGQSALHHAAERWYFATKHDENNSSRKAWITQVIKKLLLSGADTTKKTDYQYLSINAQETPLTTLSRCHEKIPIQIDEIFNALQPGIDARRLSDHEQILVDAYDQMPQGKHDELRNQLLVLPDALHRKGVPQHVFSCPIYKVFKRESIKPLLYFLAEKQYQRTMADRIAPEDDVARMEGE